jgi:DNA helicase-2/ATP-dependent DNA helicase PcrA
VKDALAYLKLLKTPQDSMSLLRIINTPARGIGKTTVEQLERLAAARGVPLWEAIGLALESQELGPRGGTAVGVFRRMIEELRAKAEEAPLHETVTALLERSGYRKMLEEDPSPEAEARLGNLEELVSAAADAHERGETLADFLDHAALVSDADGVDEAAQVSLLTIHNAKGLEFPVVFLAGLEEGLFPHSRSRESEADLEEERRLCYVGMTRAERRLYLSWARLRRRFGGTPPEPSAPSRFLEEIPRQLVEELNPRRAPGEVDLDGEQSLVREVARKTTYTGKTYNSLDHIAQFFAERGLGQPGAAAKAAAPAARPVAAPAMTASQASPAKPKAGGGGIRLGSTVEHPKYGRGTVLRKEGDGDGAKLTVSFPGHGLKKLIAKFATLR